MKENICMRSVNNRIRTIRADGVAPKKNMAMASRTTNIKLTPRLPQKYTHLLHSSLKTLPNLYMVYSTFFYCSDDRDCIPQHILQPFADRIVVGKLLRDGNK